MQPYTIRKPHYELRNFMGAVHGTMQERGDFVCVNIHNGDRKAVAVGSAARALTNCGRGTIDPTSKAELKSALHYLFREADGTSRLPDLIAVKLSASQES